MSLISAEAAAAVAIGVGVRRAVQYRSGVEPNVVSQEAIARALSESAPLFLEELGLDVSRLPVSEIGSGAFARAYQLDDGRVLKLTTDRDDAEAAELVRRLGPIEGLLLIEDVRRISDSRVTERRFHSASGAFTEDTVPLYAIVSEPVVPLKQTENEDAEMAVETFRELIEEYGSHYDDYVVGQYIIDTSLDPTEAEPEFERYFRAITHGWKWLSDSGYEVADLHDGNFGIGGGDRLVLFDFGFMSQQPYAPKLPIAIASNSGLRDAQEIRREGDFVVADDAGGVQLRFRVPEHHREPTPEEHWKTEHGGYYVWTANLSIEDLLRRWTRWSAKAYDDTSGSLQLPTGEWFQGIYSWKELWPYRRDDRPVSQPLIEGLKEHGWLSPVLLIIGKNGCIELGEGNHREAAAKQLGLQLVPVRLWFVQKANCPSDEERRERKREYERGQHHVEREQDVAHHIEFYKKRGIEKNPPEMPRVTRAFDEAIEELDAQFPDVGGIELRRDDAAGADNGAGAERQFAYCKDGDPIVIAFAFKAENLPVEHLRGLMRHEFGHALEYQFGVRELEDRFGEQLPKEVERRADAIAEAIWGEPIEYDVRDVQCVGAGGTTPRPRRLPDERETLKANAREPLRLHIWASPEGGVSRQWAGAAVSSFDPFFTFGRCGSGWSPMRSLSRHREKLEEEAELCAERARERFGRDVEIVWGPPGEERE